MTRAELFKPLAYAGALPFIACALLVHTGIWSVPYLGATDYIAAAYGLAIISFLAGTHWSFFILFEERIAPHLLLTSNIITVITWVGFLFLPAQDALLLNTGAFAGLLYFDYQIAGASITVPKYIATRRTVTAIVVLSSLAIWSAL